ncbi:MAG: T9SS type A sorting domain-containing protein [Saprospiraceae bacterium]|nr:T9SS type A sorting domain-containing protein [Saprospiraceae bacterium]
MNQVGKGIITTSWNEAQSVSYGKEDVLFTIAFRALSNGDLEESVQVNSKVTAAEAYNTWAEVQGVDLAFKANGSIASNGFALYQNNPNPFNSNTVIGFNLPEASSATLKIMDVTGKLIKQIDGEYVKGLNQITINKTDLQASGILYYQLETGKFTATRKMIIVE